MKMFSNYIFSGSRTLYHLYLNIAYVFFKVVDSSYDFLMNIKHNYFPHIVKVQRIKYRLISKTPYKSYKIVKKASHP